MNVFPLVKRTQLKIPAALAQQGAPHFFKSLIKINLTR
jgi:hypothetical protein